MTTVEECPICMEDMGEGTTRITTECCNKTLHLECMKKCEYTCPLCRSDAIITMNDTRPLIVQSVHNTPHFADRVSRYLMMTFVSLGVVYYMLMLSNVYIVRDSSPPPPL